jgi:hypothetical protein
MHGIEVADVTVCTATIPTRVELLDRAIKSVTNQTLKVKEHSIKIDLDKLGQPAVLDQIIEKATTNIEKMAQGVADTAAGLGTMSGWFSKLVTQTTKGRK